MKSYQDANQLIFNKKSKNGHYESYFLRANHSSKKLAFWFRYTIFKSKNSGQAAIAEVWGAFFKEGEIVAIQQDIPLDQCDFTSSSEFLGLSTNKLTFLKNGKASVNGELENKQNSITWQLNYTGNCSPLLLLPSQYYKRRLPKAKALVGLPNALFDGSIQVNNKSYTITNWQGSENHNWGSQHTDEYAWGQVCGFDNKPNSFLECSTARIKLGPFWSPWMNLAVLRIAGKEYRFSSLWQAINNQGHYGYFDWTMQCESREYQLQIKIKGSPKDFVAFYYKNPPGGRHTCLNSKVAFCEIILSKNGKETHRLTSQNKAAFEILTDDKQHGIELRNI